MVYGRVRFTAQCAIESFNLNDATQQHQQILNVADYISALDTLCNLARHTLFIFENNFSHIGFNSSERVEILRIFLRSNPNNRLQILAHDTKPLSQYCPRLMTLLRQFGHSMFIYQTPKNLKQLSEPFAVADEKNYVRRFHFDDTRGVLTQNDGENARLLQARFNDMWQVSQPNASTSSFTL